jgi:hypothetical protein
MTSRSNTGSKSFKLSSAISPIVTAVGLIYLFLVLVGTVNKDRFGQTEAIIFTTILILNSGVVEKLEKFEFGKNGITLELEKKVQEVEQKQEQIKELGQSNRANIEGVVQFLVRSFLTKHEYSHLKKIAENQPFKYTKSIPFENELRRLRDLGLIESPTEKHLSISRLPRSGADLRNDVQITDLGKECLSLVKNAFAMTKGEDETKVNKGAVSEGVPEVELELQ